MSLRLCVLLWEQEGRGDDLAAFEDGVLGLIPKHGGSVISRGRVIDRQHGDPLEVQVIDLPDDAALAAYMQDPVREELASTHDRDAIIARTQVLRVGRIS
jgi:uncharacterized protein (DUF1330 family)